MSIEIKYFVLAVLCFYQSVKSFEERMMRNAPFNLEHEPNSLKSTSFDCVYYDSNENFEILERAKSFDKSRNRQLWNERNIELSDIAPKLDLDTQSDSKSNLSDSASSDGEFFLGEQPKSADDYKTYLQNILEISEIANGEKKLIAWATSDLFNQWLQSYPNDLKNYMETLEKILINGRLYQRKFPAWIVLKDPMEKFKVENKKKSASKRIIQNTIDHTIKPLLMSLDLRKDKKLLMNVTRENLRQVVIIILEYALKLVKNKDFQCNRSEIQEKIKEILEKAVNLKKSPLDQLNLNLIMGIEKIEFNNH
ncbi:hypothetical protein BY996DRAFT_8065933 [Phakopsora pachyrhizi]|uniref:Expressed protein n=1 Tax=Phakopsora pachyrhizi TaxID=170000 RepID=A0AAV0ASA2_PHAPC|nr:hypothetical protein BY996DRAFT_8065933 [Phakopsora pachyrhizi]CAH7671360.1 expressed protein [Phakopsora pachyrhizi]